MSLAIDPASVRTEPSVRVELLSDPIYLSGARELVAAVARRLGFRDVDCGQIALAVDEALCNVMRHGYDKRLDQPIWLSLWPYAGTAQQPVRGITIMLEDLARQIEPEQIRGRELTDIRPGGLGVHMIREIMQRAEYAKRDGGGMRLTMSKELSVPGESKGDSHA